MSSRPRNPMVLFALGALFAAPLFVSCKESSSDGSGAGGATGTGGTPATGTGGFDPSAGGTPFMSLAGKDSGACKKTGESCTLTGDCCVGNLCNRYGPAPEWIGCQIACTDGTQCPSGCCYHFQGNNGGFCTDAKWCACGKSGDRCSSTLPACCDTHVCLGSDPNTSVCRQKCTQNADCDTQCCVVISGGLSACLDKATYCP